MNDISRAQAASLLRWWSEAGVDCLVGETPRDWLRAHDRPASPAETPALFGAAPAPAPPADAPPPAQLSLFRAWLAEAADLPFASPSAPRVCPSGDPASGLMILIDMPSAADCASGTLLSGPEGRLFDRMLAAIGRDRESVYLASLSCLRSPDGRFDADGARRCADLARHHVDLASPERLLLFGDACARALVGEPMLAARGRWHRIDTEAGPVPARVTLPPAMLLAQPAAKAHAWADLLALMEGPPQ